MNEAINRVHQKKTHDRKMAGCAGKAPYSTYTEADNEVRNIRAHSSKPVKPYKCQFCQKYHIGRSRPKHSRR